MAKRNFEFEEARKGDALRDEEKSRAECFHFAQAIKPWLPTLEGFYGPLRSLTHLSSPDDPPDVMAHFERADVGFEITYLLPNGIAKFFDRLKEMDGDKHCTVAPTLSGPRFMDEKGNAYSDRMAIASYAFGSGELGEGWVSVQAENKEWKNAAWTSFQKKVEKWDGKAPYLVLVVVPPNLFGDVEELALDLNQKIRQHSTPLPGLLLYRGVNAEDYSTYLIRQGQQMGRIIRCVRRQTTERRMGIAQ